MQYPNNNIPNKTSKQYIFYLFITTMISYLNYTKQLNYDIIIVNNNSNFEQLELIVHIKLNNL